MNVAFHLTKKDDRIAATNITTVDGENIELSEDRRPSTTPQQRTIIDATQRYAGTVLFYNWDKMFGSIRIDAGEEIPEEVKNHKKNGIRREGSSLYFHWKDLVSTDKIRGINSDIRVSFTLYTDQKGVGAADIRPENGGEFSGVVRIRRGPRNRGRGARAEKAKETPAKASTDEEEEEKEDPPKERPSEHVAGGVVGGAVAEDAAVDQGVVAERSRQKAMQEVLPHRAGQHPPPRLKSDAQP